MWILNFAFVTALGKVCLMVLPKGVGSLVNGGGKRRATSLELELRRESGPEISIEDSVAM